jgi:alcohol dehydrogenase (cytochrome c)
MNTRSTFLVITLGLMIPAFLLAQGRAKPQGHGDALDPDELLRPLAESWPTYSGDYSGRRYSALTQINQSNVKNLALAWVSRVTAGPGAGGAGAPPPGTPGVPSLLVGGEGSGSVVAGGGTNIRSAVLAVNGILYFTTPDNAWAVDARDGHEIWHYFWKTRGGTHIGNRGVGMWRSYLFMETPDDYLVSLDARTGKERWHREISSFAQEYFSTMAPIVVGNHVLVGTGNDLDAPGFLQSFDPETGDLQWSSTRCR